MILLIFVLLMALAAALAMRDKQIAALDKGGASKLLSQLQEAYPEAKSADDYFKELKRAVEIRKIVESGGIESGGQRLAEDAAIGREAREAALAAGASDPVEYVREAIGGPANGKKGWPPFFSLSELGGYYFDSGKATLRPEFEASLRKTVIPLLVKNIKDWDVDVVEVSRSFM